MISGFWELIKEFVAAAHGGGGGNHMLLTFKNVMWFSGDCFYGSIYCEKKEKEEGHKFFWITIALIVITMVIGIILPWGPITKMLGLG